MNDQSGLIDSVANGTALAKSPALRKLLLYLWDHRAEPALSEYAIAVDVFGKRADFDPKLDATVRVQISRLRQKLRDQQEQQGAGPRLTIPHGSHRLEIEGKAPDPVVAPVKRQWARWWIAALIAITAGLAIWNRNLAKEVEQLRRTAELPEIWRTLLQPGRLTRVVYPIPVFYSWGELRVRDVTLNEPDGWRMSQHLAPLVERLGPPRPSQSYSVAIDTAAAIQLTRYLSGRGIAMEVSGTQDLSLDHYGKENLVFLGIPHTSAELDRYTLQTNFSMPGGTGSVVSRKPLPGEPAVFASKTGPESAKQESFGVIAALPGHAPDSSLILLMGQRTDVLATFLTSPRSLDGFVSAWRKNGKPSHFEVVVRGELEGNILKSATVAAFRRIDAKN